jgi:hypothetical protein
VLRISIGQQGRPGAAQRRRTRIGDNTQEFRCRLSRRSCCLRHKKCYQQCCSHLITLHICHKSTTYLEYCHLLQILYVLCFAGPAKPSLSH